jgi:hypothetical protein
MLHMLQEIPFCSQGFSLSRGGSVQHACDMKRTIFRSRKSKPAAPCEATDQRPCAGNNYNKLALSLRDNGHLGGGTTHAPQCDVDLAIMARFANTAWQLSGPFHKIWIGRSKRCQIAA